MSKENKNKKAEGGKNKETGIMIVASICTLCKDYPEYCPGMESSEYEVDYPAGNNPNCFTN